jgi:hypothetical protein
MTEFALPGAVEPPGPQVAADSSRPAADQERLAVRATDAERVFLGALVVALLTGVAAWLVFGHLDSTSNYRDGIEMAQTYFSRHSHDDGFRPDLSLLYVMSLARASDAQFTKASALFLAYLVILLGSLFTLKGIQAAYRLRVAGAGKVSALETSSPGLVLITLGTILVATTFMTQSTFDTHFTWGGAASHTRGAGSSVPVVDTDSK